MNYIDHAHDLTMEGFNPLPIKENKLPQLPKDHGFLYQPIKDIDNIFKECAKLAIACGDVSGGFYALDFDAHKNEPIKDILDEFLNVEFVRALFDSGCLSLYKTAGGGFHIYFRVNKTFHGEVLARWAKDENDKENVMIEIRGNGQYIIVNPTPGYELIDGVEFSKLTYIDDETVIQLKTIAQSLSQSEVKPKESSNGKQWPSEWSNSTVTGQFNNESEELVKDLLVEQGWQYIQTRKDNVEMWVRPGKDPKNGISATWGKQFNMWYVFSSSAQPFEPFKAYNPFQIYTLLKFGGDWKKAKDSLRPKIELKEDQNKSARARFPIDVFPYEIQFFMSNLNKSLNYNTDFLSVAFMFSVSTMIGNKFKVRVKNGWESPPIFWFVALGAPGTQKTHPLKTMIKPLLNIDKSNKEIFDKELAQYNPDSKEPRPKFNQMIVSDATLEALHHVHDFNKRGLGVYKDELKGFLNDFNKYRKGSDEEFWLESFNNTSYIINRVTKDPMLIDNICINIIGTMQPDVLQEIVGGSVKNGLIDRFLFTAAEDQIYPMSLEDMNQKDLEFYNQFFNEVNKELQYIDDKDTEYFPLSAECLKMFQDYDKKLVKIQNSDTINNDLKNYASKMKSYYPRFALLTAAIDWIFDDQELEITPDNMERAKSICDYFLDTAKNVFGDIENKKELNEVTKVLNGKTKKEKILILAEKGFKGSEIAKQLKTYPSYVSKVIQNYNENKG